MNFDHTKDRIESNEGAVVIDNAAAIPGWAGITTTQTAHQEIFCKGGKRFTIPKMSAMNFTPRAVALDSVDFKCKGWLLEGGISRNGSDTVTLIDFDKSPIFAQEPETVTWDIDVTADNTNKALAIDVTPDSLATKTIKWTVTGICAKAQC